MIKSPTTYHDWVIILELFGNGDNNTIEEMNKGSFLIDAGTANRFYSKIEETYKKRKENWLDRFQKSFQINNIKTENELGIVLNNGKKSLLPLLKFTEIKSFPEDIKIVLKKDLNEFVNEVKKSFKESTKDNFLDKERVLLTLNSFDLPNIIEDDRNLLIDSKYEALQNTGRKIIF